MPTGTSLAQELTLEQLYDALMYEVEPELTMDSMQYLDAWYVGETDGEHVLRMYRYERAFSIVDERMKTMLSTWKEELSSIKERILLSNKTKKNS